MSHINLVEAAGVEPASVSPLPSAPHAWTPSIAVSGQQPGGQDVGREPVLSLTAPPQADFAANQFYMTVSSAGLVPC